MNAKSISHPAVASNLTPGQSDGLAQAWDAYCEALKAAGRLVLDPQTPSPELDKPEGLRMLTRLVRYGLEAGLEFADPDYPVFYHPSHETLKIMSDNPDTLHFMATIRDDADYLIEGTRGSVARIVFTTLARAPNGAGLTLLNGIASDRLAIDPDGRIRLRVSRERHDGNWLPLEAGAQSLLVRAIFNDRASEIAPTLRIGRVDPPAPPALDGTLLSARLKAAAMISVGTARAMIGYGDLIRNGGWINTFGANPSSWAAGDPGAFYSHGSWRLSENEALVISFKPPPCFIWNLQINNVWAESLDYLHHRIHVNKHNAIADAEGNVRVVVAHQDPCCPNWLDTAGHSSGTMLARWIDAEHAPDLRCGVVNFDEIRRSTRNTGI